MAYVIALAQKKPLVVYFHEEWCGYCVTLKKQALFSKEVNEFADQAIFVQVDPETDDTTKNVSNTSISPVGARKVTAKSSQR